MACSVCKMRAGACRNPGGDGHLPVSAVTHYITSRTARAVPAPPHAPVSCALCDLGPYKCNDPGADGHLPLPDEDALVFGYAVIGALRQACAAARKAADSHNERQMFLAFAEIARCEAELQRVELHVLAQKDDDQTATE